jgi:pimeloyl-ACP methyl ester carboxylesterase
LNQLTFDNYQKQANFSELCGHRIAHWQSLNFHQELNKEPNKEIILFIHGFPSAAWDWHFQWKHLAGQYRLLSLDLLGFGLSEKPIEHQYSLLEQADIVQALLISQGVKQYHVLAHDYGDSVAQELLSRQDDKDNETKILSLCFLNGGLFASHHRPLFAQKLLKSRFGGLASHFMNKASLSRGFNKIFAANSQPNEHEIDTLWQLLEHNNGKKVLPKLLSYIDERSQHGKRWVESMISNVVPLYFINGVHDPISGQHMLDHYIDIIPHPRTTALDVGHYPQLEAPEKVLSLYRTFLIEIRS